MKRGWRVILTIVLIVAVLGVVFMGVGFITGADLSRIYSVFDDRYNFILQLYHSGAHSGLPRGGGLLNGERTALCQF